MYSNSIRLPSPRGGELKFDENDGPVKAVELPSPRGGELKSFRENRGREAVPQRGLREPAAHAVRTAAK